MPCEVSRTLMPDDMDVPQSLYIRHICEDGRYVLAVGGSDLLKLKNTVDDIMRCLKVVETVWRELGGD
ncbi:MAG: KEOPS complex subunit Pcc1 [Thermoproteus sp.]